jgi:hypothetical protein
MYTPDVAFEQRQTSGAWTDENMSERNVVRSRTNVML